MASHLAALAAAALIATTAGVAAAQAPVPNTSPPFPASAPMPTGNPEAMANVHQSVQYNAAMRANTGFRQRRMRQECGPITDPQLHESCIASFQAYK
jgi:hypothetical protein